LKRDLRFRAWLAASRFVECLTREQLRIFVEHGYVEGTVTKPVHSKFDGMSKKTLLAMWREDERFNIKTRGRSYDEKRFYLRNGHFPDGAKD
jgi:hypothetical protein